MIKVNNPSLKDNNNLNLLKKNNQFILKIIINLK